MGQKVWPTQNSSFEACNVLPRWLVSISMRPKVASKGIDQLFSTRGMRKQKWADRCFGMFWQFLVGSVNLILVRLIVRKIVLLSYPKTWLKVPTALFQHNMK